MENMALAGYLQMLRNGQRAIRGKPMPQSELAEMISQYIHGKIGQYDISRIETGGQAPDGDVFIAWLELLGGSYEDAVRLVKDKEATHTDGQQQAIKALSRKAPTEEQRLQIMSLVDEVGLETITAAVRQLIVAEQL